MRSRNLILLLAGVTVALITLFVSWRFGVVFFLLPLFFVWSWGGDGCRRAGRGDEDALQGRGDERGGDDGPATSEEEPAMGEEDRPGRGGNEDERGDERGLDGEGI